MRHVINYKGRQVHSSRPLIRVKMTMLVFEGGDFCDVGDGTSFACPHITFVDSTDVDFVPEQAITTDEIVIIDIREGMDGSILVLGRNGRFPVLLGYGCLFSDQMIQIGMDRPFL